MTYAEFYQDIKNEFVGWLDDEQKYSLHHIINCNGNEMYAVYNMEEGFECGSCYADDKNELIMWAKEMIPHWKAINAGGDHSVRE